MLKFKRKKQSITTTDPILSETMLVIKKFAKLVFKLLLFTITI